MINNKKTYSKFLLLIIVFVVLTSTQSFAAAVTKVTGLKSESVSSTQARLTWTKISNATGYEVYIKEDGKAYSSIGKVRNSNVLISGVVEGRVYYAKVRAYVTTNGSTSYGQFSSAVKVTAKSSGTNTSLAKVTNLKVTNTTTTTATLTWSNVVGSTGYQVYIKEGNSTYQNIGTVSNSGVTINGLTSNTTIYVKIRAYKNVNGSTTYGAYSDEIKVTTKAPDVNTKVGAVTNLKSTGTTNTTATLTWTAVSNITGYQVYLKTGNGAFNNIGNVNANNITINGLTAGTTYTVKIRAYRTTNNSTVYGSYSNAVKFTTTGNDQDNTKLGKVTNLRVTATANTTASLTWTAVANASGYQVYVKEGNNAYKYIGNTSNSNVTINGLTAGTTYNVKIRAYRQVNGSTTYGDYSNTVKFTTTGNNQDNTKLGKVTNLRVTATANTTASLTWTAVANASGYQVYVKEGNNAYKYIGNTSNLNVTINGLTAGTTYNVKVRAYRQVNGLTTYGDYSNVVKFTTTGTNPEDLVVDTVTNLMVNLNGTIATLEWKGVSNVAGYEIYLNIPGSGYQSLGTTYKTTTTINALRTGTTYTAKVRAYRQVNGQMVYGNFSNEVTFTTQKAPNPQPVKVDKVTNLAVNNIAKTSADFTWNKLVDVTGYEVYVNNKSYGTTTNNSVSAKDLTAGTTYTVKVRAYKTLNGSTTYGDFSNEVKFTTQNDQVNPQPGNLGKVLNINANVGATMATFTWNRVADADGYEIQISIAGKGYQSLGNTVRDNVRILGLTAQTQYSVKIRAYKMVNGQKTYGEFSDEYKFTTNQNDTLGKVTNLKVNPLSNSARLTWNLVDNAQGYEISVKKDNGEYKVLGNVINKNTVRIVNLAKGSTFTVRVRAYKVVSGNTIYGDYSNEVNFKGM